MRDGGFGVGVVSNCSVKNPYYTWYKNGEVFKKGVNLFWIMCDEEGNPWVDTWACTINCSKLDNINSNLMTPIQSDSSTSSVNSSGKTHADPNSNISALVNSRSSFARPSLANKTHLNSHSNSKTVTQTGPLSGRPSLANKTHPNPHSNSKTSVQPPPLPLHPD